MNKCNFLCHSVELSNCIVRLGHDRSHKIANIFTKSYMKKIPNANYRYKKIVFNKIQRIKRLQPI